MSDKVYEREIVLQNFYQHINNGGFHIKLIKKVELQEDNKSDTGYRCEVSHFLETGTSTMGVYQTNRIPLYSGCEAIFSRIAHYFEEDYEVRVDNWEAEILEYSYPSLNDHKINPAGFSREDKKLYDDKIRQEYKRLREKKERRKDPHGKLKSSTKKKAIGIASLLK